MGLGLAIARQLIDLHHGTVRAESEGHGKGTTFIIVLPLERQADGSARVSPDEGPPITLTDRKLLLVEDSQETREALTKVLASAGAKVTAACGRHGI
jgi:PleD family two-component response regulator